MMELRNFEERAADLSGDALRAELRRLAQNGSERAKHTLESDDEATLCYEYLNSFMALENQQISELSVGELRTKAVALRTKIDAFNDEWIANADDDALREALLKRWSEEFFREQNALEGGFLPDAWNLDERPDGMVSDALQEALDPKLKAFGDRLVADVMALANENPLVAAAVAAAFTGELNTDGLEDQIGTASMRDAIALAVRALRVVADTVEREVDNGLADVLSASIEAFVAKMAAGLEDEEEEGDA